MTHTDLHQDTLEMIDIKAVEKLVDIEVVDMVIVIEIAIVVQTIGVLPQMVVESILKNLLRMVCASTVVVKDIFLVTVLILDVVDHQVI